MNEDYFTDQVYNLMRLLFQTQHTMAKGRDRELAKYGITREQASVLHCIRAKGYPPTITELSRWLLRESHTITNLIKRMEQKGLIMKFQDPQKRNSIRLALTPKGEQAFNKAVKRAFYNRIMSVLSGEEREQVWNSLKKLRDEALKEIGMDIPPFPHSL